MQALTAAGITVQPVAYDAAAAREAVRRRTGSRACWW